MSRAATCVKTTADTFAPTGVLRLAANPDPLGRGDAVVKVLTPREGHGGRFHGRSGVLRGWPERWPRVSVPGERFRRDCRLGCTRPCRA